MTLSTGIPLSLDSAHAAFRSGDIKLVEDMARAALDQAPDNADWLKLLATVYAVSGRSAEAGNHFGRLVAMNPDDGEQWSNLGNALCDARDYAKAVDALKKAIALQAYNPYAHFALARSYQALGQAKLAMEHASEAVKSDPQDAGFRILLAGLRLWLDDWDNARADLGQLHNQRLSVQQLIDVADLYLQMSIFETARSAFNAAIRMQPDNVDAYLGLGLLEERVNALADAQTCVDKVTAICKARDQAVLPERLQQLSARLAFRNKNFQQAADTLQALLVKPPADPMLHSHLLFELGSALDQAGQYDSAWQAFTNAHMVRADHLSIGYKGIAGNDLLEILGNPPPAAQKKTSSPASDKNKDPVFIVGFPRSGTTLLEQILDSQDGLASFDEQSFLQRLLVQLRAQGLRYPQDLDKVDSALQANFRQSYFDYVSTVVPGLGERQAVDKNPLNLVRLPFAQSFLPGSKVILAIRHPCDVVLSCYMQSFRTPVLQTSFSSLEATAELYAKVMKYWVEFRDQLNLPTYIHLYEDLVTDPVKSTQALANFLELPWSESWLDAAGHVRGKGVIRTPSYAQVSEPINQKAKGRWLRYRANFSETTIAHLAPWIAEFGYPEAQ